MASATAAAPPEVLAKPAARILSEKLGDRVLAISDFRGDLAITVARGAWVEAARLLKNHPELDYKLFLDLCAVDHLDRPGHAERFEVVLHVYSVSTKHHVRLKTAVPESDAKLPTLVQVYRGANWFEREAWDLYGVVFEGHPNLSCCSRTTTSWATRCGRTIRPQSATCSRSRRSSCSRSPRAPSTC